MQTFAEKSQEKENFSTESTASVQRKAMTTVQRKSNGLPTQLKSGIESLSGMSMDDVTVHYNSSKPAQMKALAYTQGTDIHVGPGQEQHLGHEAWHVVQQKQGRVAPTTQMKGVNVNDDSALEHEADVMGSRAVQIKSAINTDTVQWKSAQGVSNQASPVQMREIQKWTVFWNQFFSSDPELYQYANKKFERLSDSQLQKLIRDLMLIYDAGKNINDSLKNPLANQLIADELVDQRERGDRVLNPNDMRFISKYSSEAVAEQMFETTFGEREQDRLESLRNNSEYEGNQATITQNLWILGFFRRLAALINNRVTVTGGEGGERVAVPPEASGMKYLAKLMGGGGRTQINLPAGTEGLAVLKYLFDDYFNTDTKEITEGRISGEGGRNGFSMEGAPMFNRGGGTHYVDDDLREKKGNLAWFSSKGIGSRYVHFGMNIAMGGLGNVHSSTGETIKSDGRFGHLYIGYKTPTEDKAGALLLGLESDCPPTNLFNGATNTYGHSHTITARGARIKGGGSMKESYGGKRNNARVMQLEQVQQAIQANVAIRQLANQLAAQLGTQ